MKLYAKIVGRAFCRYDSVVEVSKKKGQRGIFIAYFHMPYGDCVATQHVHHRVFVFESLELAIKCFAEQSKHQEAILCHDTTSTVFYDLINPPIGNRPTRLPVGWVGISAPRFLKNCFYRKTAQRELLLEAA